MSAPTDSQFAWYFVWHCFVLRPCWLQIKVWGVVFIVSSMSAFMLTQYLDSHASSLVFPIPTWFRCSCFSVLSCNDAGTIILLLFMAIPLVIAISSLNDQYDCSSFCTSVFVDGQPQNAFSDRIPKCPLFSVANLIFLAVMQSGMSMHDYCIDGYVHAWYSFVSVCLMIVSGQPNYNE